MFLDENRTRIFSFSRDALTQLSYQLDNRSITTIPRENDGQEARWESISCPMVRGLNALAVSRFTDNPNSTARRKNSMGKWRDRTEALHAGNRTRTAKAFATDGTPSLWWRINDQLRPIEIGVTNRIRTGTNGFTGRDAAVTS